MVEVEVEEWWLSQREKSAGRQHSALYSLLLYTLSLLSTLPLPLHPPQECCTLNPLDLNPSIPCDRTMNRCTFPIQPASRFAGSNTSIRRPREIACFSYDDSRQFHLGDVSLRYYYPPSLPADLNRGFDSFQQLDDSADEHLDALLETIVALERESRRKCEADVVTWRGMMTKVSQVGWIA
jgi:hypothetical protein